MGANGSRLCLFSVETSDVAHFPQLREIRTPSPSSSPSFSSRGINFWQPVELIRRILGGYTMSPDAGQREPDDVARPWLPHEDSNTIDIDGPPRPLTDDYDFCLGFRCPSPAISRRFESRTEALQFASQAASEGDDFSALRAYESALNFRQIDQQAPAVPGIPRSAAIPHSISSDARNNIKKSLSPPLTPRQREDAAIFDKCAGICFEGGQPEKASLYLEHATWLDKTNVGFWYRRAVVYQQRSAWETASECFSRCLDLDSNYAPAFFHLGLLHSKTRRYEEAVQCFNSLLAIDPGHTEAMVLLAACHEKLGRVNEALVTIEKVLGIDSDYMAAKQLRDTLKEKLGVPLDGIP